MNTGYIQHASDTSSRRSFRVSLQRPSQKMKDNADVWEYGWMKQKITSTKSKVSLSWCTGWTLNLHVQHLNNTLQIFPAQFFFSKNCKSSLYELRHCLMFMQMRKKQWKHSQITAWHICIYMAPWHQYMNNQSGRLSSVKVFFHCRWSAIRWIVC